ncbi:putative sporulation protein YtxC [Ectobacillus polymachus]|uniref:putative sporulation protein YtxC n=1 Tax=Ectobacillus polymachus TaxID=1508806 RepID=UPI003A8BFE1A
MIEISFEDEQDAYYLYERLKKASGRKEEESTVLLEHSKLIIKIAGHTYIREVLIPEITQFILKVKEVKWMRSILMNSFFYHDSQEHREIIHIAYSILCGERTDIPRSRLDFSRKQFIVASLRSTIQHNLSFSFEAYVRFRLRPYMMYINQLIELAIDEYKLEQDYQAFIEMLRQQVSAREALLSSLHIVFRDHVYFYDETGSRISQETLYNYMDERGLQQDEYVDRHVIAPLLSIAPRDIHIYTAHEDDTMIVTIRNVFQERVKLYSLCEFEKRRENL